MIIGFDKNEKYVYFLGVHDETGMKKKITRVEDFRKKVEKDLSFI